MSRKVWFVVFVSVFLGLPASAAFAAFISKHQNAVQVSSKTDFIGPSVISSVVQKSEGGVPGYIRSGGNFNIFANINDNGNPAAGINASTVEANGWPLSLAANTIAGVTYNYKTNAVHSAVGATGDVVTPVFAANDLLGNTLYSSNASAATFDNTAPTISLLDFRNRSGGIAGRIETGDWISLRHTEPTDPISLVGSDWNTGTASANVLVSFQPNTASSCPIQVMNMSSVPYPAFGTLDGGGPMVTALTTFAATLTVGTGTPTEIRLTIGAVQGTNSVQTYPGGTGSWIGATTNQPFDWAGNLAVSSTRTEAGGFDANF